MSISSAANRLWRWLIGPEAEDVAMQSVTGLLWIAQVSMLSAGLLLIPAAALFGWGLAPQTAIAGLTVMMVVNLVLMKQSWVRLAGFLTLLTPLALATYLLTTSTDGLHDIAILVYPGVIVAAGLTLNRPMLFMFMALAIAALGFTTYLEITGQIATFYMAHQTSLKLLGDLAVAVVILIATTAFVRLYIQNLLGSLTRLHRQEQGLLASNRELQREIAERRAAEAGLRQREALLGAVAFAAEEFLKTPDWRLHISHVLERLGRAAGASRAYLVENQFAPTGVITAALRYQWTAPDQALETAEPAWLAAPLREAGPPQWYAALAGGEVYPGHAGSFSAADAPGWAKRGRLAVLDAPVRVGDHWWGLIGFEDRRQARAWTPAEIDALKVAADIIGTAMHRERADAALRESEARYRVISTASSDYVFSSRIGPDGQLQLDWVGGAFEAITGYALADYVARGGWRAALHADDIAQDTRDMAQLGAGQPVVTEVRTWRRDGQLRWVKVYARPLWNEPEQRLAGIDGAVQDITARKQAEAEITRLNLELEQRVRDRTAELEAFSYSVSHDLRAPLRAVDGYARILLEDYGAAVGAEGQGYLNRMRAGAQRMGALIDGLLMVSRLGRQALQPAALSGERLRQMVGEVISEAQAAAPDRAVEWVLGPLPACNADPGLARQVWANLLGNAFKYSRGRNPAVIEIGHTGIAYYVKDNGVGFDPAYADRLFGVFQRLHREDEFEGTGVGLATTKRIVERHGGRIWAQAAAGQGATFYFTLAPAAP